MSLMAFLDVRNKGQSEMNKEAEGEGCGQLLKLASRQNELNSWPDSSLAASVIVR